jgi:two-component system NtrC family sensor kinase
VKKSIPSKFPEAELDSDAMEQVALNLIKNGLQAVKEDGSVEVKLSVRGRKPNKHILLQVIDDGPGIPEGELERIFEPYYSSKARGMGLGMHIVKQIVEAHGGRIVLESQVGQGTSVNVEIPFRRE